MDILEQCRKWHENDEYQKIIDALEAIPAQERTPEMDSELARAYNNQAGPQDRELFRKAIALLKPHGEYFARDHYWNFRMGYAYFYLDQEGRALRYFEKALEARPGDADTQELIDWCRKGIALPRFSACFRERMENWWETFAEMEAGLRRMMDEDKDHTRGAEIVAQMEGALNLVFDDIAFEMGFNGEKYELILTPEGDKVKLFALVYFRKHAPKEVLEHWNILVGRQPNANFGLRTEDGWEVSGEDVQVWLEEQGEHSFAISAYCGKLLPMLRENENRAWWMLATLTDQVLGEIPHMRYIDSFDVLETPKVEPAILLSQLPDALKARGLELSTDPEAYLESYLGYKMEPNQDPDADWRLDVMAGSTNCVPLINGYLNADNDFMDALHADGAVAGFFCYPLDTLREEEGTEKIFDFRDKLEELFTTGDGPEVLTLTGGATGLYCGYVDFIAWDIREALQMAKEFFEDSDIPWASFHTFRREAGTVNLKTPPEEEPDNEDQAPELEEPLTGMDYTPYTPENADAFYRQLEQWNDQDEYTRCIQALNAIPEEGRDYRSAYALARALENYAIIGDHDEGTPSRKGDKALRRAIEVLESVREEGQDRAEWNMRMAYAYQYLPQQEEQAIPYAQRWMELDPEDENAPAVIRECQEKIEKRGEAEDESDHTGVFTGFVLLSKGEWDKGQFIRDMKELWDITVAEYDASEDKSDEALVFEVGDMLAAVSLATSPIPNGEAEINAENNYMWPDAVKAAREHRAHIMAAVLGKEEDLLEKGKLFTKLLAACCRQEHATGVYTSGVVFEPRFYEGFAKQIREDELPIFNWVWFGLYRSEGGMNAYTYGMDVFGKEEMEVLEADAEPGDLRDFLASLAAYVLEGDVELHDGETIGFSADDKHAITRSPGVSLPEEQMTLKIAWEPGGDGPDGSGPEAEGPRGGEGSGQPKVHPETGSLLSAEDIETLEAFDEGVSGYFGKMLNWLEDFIKNGIEERKFTEKQAHQDLRIALWYAFACNNLDDYIHYYRAAEWMKDSEKNAVGCATWYYRYSVALMYCGRLEEALNYAEQGAQEEPDYPWIWLQVGKLRAHFGDKEGALAAVKRGLALEPGDYEFLTLQKEIQAGEPLERMEYHWINPNADRALQQGLDEDAGDKQRAISCITTDPEGLERFWAIFGPKPEQYTPNAPFTQFPYTAGGQTVDLVFKMNEGGMSKLRADWLKQLRGWLQDGRWLERAHPDGKAGSLDTVLVGLDYRIGLVYKLADEGQYFQIFLRPDGTEMEGVFWSSETHSQPELYTGEEMAAVEGHIQQYFGAFDNVFHEIVSPDIHVDICMVPPSQEGDYYTLVTMGMGAHRMHVPEELAEYKLERAELAIALPADWKLDQESMKDEKWYWPIRLLKSLARLPIASDTWLGWGHTVDNQGPFAEHTQLCATLLIGPQKEGGEVCTLPNGEEVNFYQVIPLYADELDYKLAHDADALLEKMAGISFVVRPDRPDAITRGTLCSEDEADESIGMDDASWHLESIEEKELGIGPISAYNHMAIYLRWCMEHDLMGDDFLKEYGEVVKRVKSDPGHTDLRPFIREELLGCLYSALFNKTGRAFAHYYYGEADSPYFPSDIDDYALQYFGPERYHSNEFREEAYLFIPFDEDYYQAMAKIIEERFINWQGQDFDEDTLEPSEVAQAIMEYLDCECTYFPSMKDDDPIMAAYRYAQRLGVREGFIPMLIKPDETLLECLVMNADPENEDDCYAFDLKTVTEYRKKMLSAPIKDGKAVLEELTGQRKEEAEDDDMDWEEEILGEMEAGYENDRFASYWDSDTDMTHPLILAKIPVRNPWEIFAYLPFGSWNECPDTPELMAAAKYWFQQYGAVPAAMSHDEMEFLLPAPVPKERAMDAAVEQYGFCPDVIDQGPEDATVGALADVLRQSTVWYFWWD